MSIAKGENDGARFWKKTAFCLLLAKQTDAMNGDQPANDISSATDYVFFPFRGMFDLTNDRKTRPAPQTVGNGLCYVNQDARPVVIWQNYSCPQHFYCPNTKPPSVDPLSLPSVCPPTLQCQLQRLSAHFCEPQGVYEPQLCPKGNYCPDFRTKIECPRGTFCPTGSTEPRNCTSMFSICPEGASFQLFYGGLMLCLVIDLILLIMYLGLRCQHNINERKKSREEMRRQSGRNIGTIAETIHSKKRALFVTLESQQDADLDAADEQSLKMAYKSMSAKLIKCMRFLKAALVPTRALSPMMSQTDLSDGTPTIEADIEVYHNASIAIEIDGNSGTLHNRSFVKSLSRVSGRKQHYSLYINDLVTGFKRAQNGEDLSLSFEFDRLSLTLPSGKTILNAVSGKIVPGRVTVIMGPSGCGKSTFMNVLMGKLDRTGGRLLINGRQIETHSYKKIVGYVPQDDVMFFELTVKENILYSARNRLPRSWNSKEIEKFVDAVLESLDLNHVADNLITSISGGQRKRVNIGMELVTCPSAIFLDEPTSGLDATAALKVVRTMKKIASTTGISIITVIHQPRFEIFDQFDDLLMIAPGGSTVYMGPSDNALTYFQNMGFYFAPRNNPADVLMDIVGGKGQKLSMLQDEEEVKKDVMYMEEYEVSELVSEWQSHEDGQDEVADTIYPNYSETNSNVSEEDDTHGNADSPDHIASTALSSATLTPQARSQKSSTSNTPGLAERILPLTTKNSFGSLKPIQSQETLEQTSSHKRLELACTKRGCGFFWQIYYVHNRSMIQQYRHVNAFLLEIFIALAAGLIIGLAVSTYDGSLYQGLVIRPFTLISPSPIELVVPMLSLLQCCAIGLSAAPAGVKIFSEEREMYFRESTAGLNSFAYFIGKNWSSIYRFMIATLHFTSPFYFFGKPNITFEKMLLIHLACLFAVYGLSFIAAMIVRRENASMIAVCTTLVMAVLCGSGPSLADMRKIYLEWLLDMSYARWVAEAWYSEELLIFDGVFEIWEVSSKVFGYSLKRYFFDILMIFVIGLAFRAIAFALMISSKKLRKRQ